MAYTLNPGHGKANAAEDDTLHFNGPGDHPVFRLPTGFFGNKHSLPASYNRILLLGRSRWQLASGRMSVLIVGNGITRHRKKESTGAQV